MSLCVCAYMSLCVWGGVCVCMRVCPFTCVFVSALAAMGRGALGGAAAPGEEECSPLHRQEALADTGGDKEARTGEKGGKHNFN